jgi:hypothetical protein
MTRGPQPLQALQEARALGSTRGIVGTIPCADESCADFTIFCAHAVIFVKIKRTRIHIHDIRDITVNFSREILHLRRIPQTIVVNRELWVRSQRGSWIYYRVCHDTIVEIRSDGTAINEAG